MNEDFCLDEVVGIAEGSGFEIVARAELPARKPKLAPIPQCLNRKVVRYFSDKYPKGLYMHQAEAIQECVDKQRDVCITTATASGKTDVFIAAAADMILRDPASRVLALYPARALIQDQLEKWSGLCELGLTINYIDGGVPVEKRLSILQNSGIVLMTPDVAHAWLLNHVGDSSTRQFLERLRLLILDEAHVYDGVFGTNMAYFLRRLEAATPGDYRIIVTTATLGEPEELVSKLTGREARCFTDRDDGSWVPEKTLLLAQGGAFSETSKLLQGLAARGRSPFLAFADSRKQVERIVAACNRQDGEKRRKEGVTGDDLDSLGEEDLKDEVITGSVVPYRAGYEVDDRVQIQRALAHGTLAGVVSTSALELGIDIGDVNLVVLLSTPPSTKSFLQRMGRGGRQRHGICLILDTACTISVQGLDSYLKRPVEPNWLYLDNRYLQYTNALCAAHELRQTGLENKAADVYRSLSQDFQEFLDNEMRPVHPVPDDLFHLKQRSEAGPHFEFPVRSGIEKQFVVELRGGMRRLGTLTFSQMLREAYPGAIYYYMARPYRVEQFKYGDGQVVVRPERQWTTEPISQTMVFPDIPGGVLALWVTQNQEGFLAETGMQVNDRVIGFRERHGGAQPVQYLYAPGSPYYQYNLTNFFKTTGVCWFFSDYATCDEGTALLLREAFCSEFGVVEREIGVGMFICKTPPIGSGEAMGYCLYDAAAGSLRLTQMLADNFAQVVATASRLAGVKDSVSDKVRVNLSNMASVVDGLVIRSQDDRHELSRTAGGSPIECTVVVLIEPGQEAIARLNPPKQVTVKAYRYTPQGIMYDLENPEVSLWSAPARCVEPIYGQTRMIKVDLMTGEETPVGYYTGGSYASE